MRQALLTLKYAKIVLVSLSAIFFAGPAGLVD